MYERALAQARKKALGDPQRLKEAVWRIQSHVAKGCRAQWRIRIINEEISLLADALGVEALK